MTGRLRHLRRERARAGSIVYARGRDTATPTTRASLPPRRSIRAARSAPRAKRESRGRVRICDGKRERERAASAYIANSVRASVACAHASRVPCNGGWCLPFLAPACVLYTDRDAEVYRERERERERYLNVRRRSRPADVGAEGRRTESARAGGGYVAAVAGRPRRRGAERPVR